MYPIKIHDYGKNLLALHRTIGKFSYVVMPLLPVTGFLLIRFVYYRDLKLGLQAAADSIRIIVLYLFWLRFFYFNAILDRKTTSIHARYMVAASLTMLGPTIDRIWYFSFGVENFFWCHSH